MKKFILLSLFTAILLFSQESQAQSNWEVGVRFPENVSIDATVPLAAAPRLHPSIYLERFGVGTYFDWLFALDGTPSGLKFYPGVGPEMFFEGRFDFAIAGNFGVEYTFDFPLTVGFDWRPAFRLTNGSDFGTGNWGIMARFKLSEFSRAN